MTTTWWSGPSIVYRGALSAWSVGERHWDGSAWGNSEALIWRYGAFELDPNVPPEAWIATPTWRQV